MKKVYLLFSFQLNDTSKQKTILADETYLCLIDLIKLLFIPARMR
jgi:hypothetical protein